MGRIFGGSWRWDMRLIWTVVVALTAVAPRAAAQTAFGGAFIVSRLPAETYIPGTFTVPPSGLTHGMVLFGGAAVTPRIGLQGELSVPSELVTLRQFSHPGATFEDATNHRDTIVSGLLRVRAVSWCDVFVGGGLTFERTTVSQTGRDNLTGDTHVETESSSATRATFTTGVDFPVRLNRHFWLLPTGRLHVVSRNTKVPLENVRTLSPPSKYAFRLGIGVRVEF